MFKNIAFKHRIIGAIFIISLGVIIIPAILDRPALDKPGMQENLPPAPSTSQLQSLDEVDYAFTELVDDLREQEVAAQVAETESAVSPQDLAPLADVTETQTEVVVAVAEQEVVVEEVQITETVDVVAQTEQLIGQDVWAVQLGAFSKNENAQALMERLQARGYEAYAQSMTDSQLTRVLVGIEADQGQAAALLADLDTNMNLKGIVVKYDPAEG